MIVLVSAQRVASARAEDPVDLAVIIASVGKSVLKIRYVCVIAIAVGVTVTVAVAVPVIVTVAPVVTAAIVTVWVIAVGGIIAIIWVAPPPAPAPEREATKEADIIKVIIVMEMATMMPIATPIAAVPIPSILCGGCCGCGGFFGRRGKVAFPSLLKVVRYWSVRLNRSTRVRVREGQNFHGRFYESRFTKCIVERSRVKIGSVNINFSGKMRI